MLTAALLVSSFTTGSGIAAWLTTEGIMTGVCVGGNRCSTGSDRTYGPSPGPSLNLSPNDVSTLHGCLTNLDVADTGDIADLGMVYGRPPVVRMSRAPAAEQRTAQLMEGHQAVREAQQHDATQIEAQDEDLHRDQDAAHCRTHEVPLTLCAPMA